MNYFASAEIFYRRFFLPTKFYGDFFSSNKVLENACLFAEGVNKSWQLAGVMFLW